ncbi:MAG: hypothetical protein JNM94_13265 [Phycisphaerae bacterium]|nr:hypothetical protein [Phycisphaerae bacterium]
MTDLRRSAALAAASAFTLGIAAASLPTSHAGAAVERRKVRAPETPGYIADRECRFEPLVVMTPEPPPMLALWPSSGDGGIAGGGGTCPPEIAVWTSSDFGPGTYILQGGFAEGECAAVSFTLPASAFPIKIDLAEMIFGTSNASVATTTKWSVLVFEGTPDVSGPKYVYSSDGDLIPHISLPPGTSGVNVQFAIDPGAPPEDQMILQDNGSHTFTVAYRIDEHNNQFADPCFSAPPSSSNAFPATDTGGLAAPANNWLFAVNCGPFGCPAGWKKFSQLPALCKPSGDWVIRVTWSSFTCAPSGACCLPTGDCEFVTAADCQTLGGTYLGDEVPCGIGSCNALNVACCFAATGGCLTLPSETCVAAGGVAGPLGSSCGPNYVCFPKGACCLPNGTCIGPVSPEECAAQNGTFKGNNTTCGTTTCPAPTGACCFPTGFCLALTETNCALAGASWAGPGTTCADANQNGKADVCEANPADLDNDGDVDPADLGILLGAWGATGANAADLNGDGVVGPADLSILLGEWS